MSPKVVKPLPPRIARWRAAVTQACVDAIIALKPETTFHVSGYNPIIISMPAVVIATGGRDPILLVHALRVAPAEEKSFLSDIRGYSSFFALPTIAANWDTAVLEVLEELGFARGKIGIEGAMTIEQRDSLAEVLPEAQFVNVSATIRTLRQIKDQDEIGSATIAGIFADVGAEAAVKKIKEG